MTKPKASVPNVKPYFALPVILPEGDYPVLMTEPKAMQSKHTGMPYVVTKCTILEGLYKDRVVFHTHFISTPGLANDEEMIASWKPVKALVEVRIRELRNRFGDDESIRQVNICKFKEILP